MSLLFFSRVFVEVFIVKTQLIKKTLGGYILVPPSQLYTLPVPFLCLRLFLLKKYQIAEEQVLSCLAYSLTAKGKGQTTHGAAPKCVEMVHLCLNTVLWRKKHHDFSGFCTK